MKKEMMKIISVALCVTTLSLTSTYITPAFAAGTSTETGTYTPYVPSNLKVSKIPKDHAYIPASVKISLENTKTIDSKTAHDGDPVKFRTLSNLIINGVTVIPAGTIANGTINKVISAGGLGRAGKLEFTVDSIETINGVRVPLTYNSTKAGQTDGGAVAVFAVVSILGGLFMKGTNVQCVEGTKIEALVSEDTDLNVTLDDLANAMSPTQPHGVNIILQQ